MIHVIQEQYIVYNNVAAKLHAYMCTVQVHFCITLFIPQWFDSMRDMACMSTNQLTDAETHLYSAVSGAKEVPSVHESDIYVCCNQEIIALDL